MVLRNMQHSNAEVFVHLDDDRKRIKGYCKRQED